MVMENLQIRHFPDQSFSCDVETQRRFSTFASFRERYHTRAVVTLLISFAAMGAFVALGWEVAVLFALCVFIGTVIFGLFISLYRPGVACSQCGRRMKKRWIEGGGADSQLFFVCDDCKRYVDSHSSVSG